MPARIILQGKVDWITQRRGHSMLTVICPGSPAGERFERLLSAALAGHAFQRVSWLTDPLAARRLLFAVSLPESGVSHGFYDLPGALAAS